MSLGLYAKSVAGPQDIELTHMADISLKMLRLSLDGFARLDVTLVTEAMRLDESVNVEYQSVARQLITYMMEDPRTISRSLDILTIAKAIERVGDHASNIAGYVIFMVKGLNVRHDSADEVEARIANS